MASKKSDAATLAGARLTGDFDGGVEGDSHRRVFRSRVGMGDRAAQGAAVADLEMSDQRGGLGQQGDAGRDDLAGADLGVGGHGAHRDGAVDPVDADQLVDAPEVDEVLESR